MRCAYPTSGKRKKQFLLVDAKSESVRSIFRRGMNSKASRSSLSPTKASSAGFEEPENPSSLIAGPAGLMRQRSVAEQEIAATGVGDEARNHQEPRQQVAQAAG